MKEKRLVWVDRFFRGLLLAVAVGILVGGGVILKRHLSQQLAAAPPAGPSGARAGFSPARVEDTLIGFYLRLRQGDLQKPASDDDTPVTFEVYPGESAASIAERLEKEGLITDAALFRMYARHYGLGTSLEAGRFTLSPNMTIPEIALKLQQASGREVSVTIPEGWRAEEIAQMLTQKGVLDGAAFLKLVKKGEAGPDLGGPYDFLADRPKGASLEGYLFPDTYRLPEQAKPEDLLRRMLNVFGMRVTPEMRQDARAEGLTLYQVVTLASIVERETALPSERPVIARVYLNRLFDKDCKAITGGYLNADPTVQYAMGYQPAQGTWWKQPLTLEEYKYVISPYNTYLHPGLPPGPIANPGIDSIKAVIYPAQNDYCFFVATGSGAHVFSRTAAEHQRQVEKYQR